MKDERLAEFAQEKKTKSEPSGAGPVLRGEATERESAAAGGGASLAKFASTNREACLAEAEKAIAAELHPWGEGPREGSDKGLYAAAYNAGVLAALRAVNGLKMKGERETW